MHNPGSPTTSQPIRQGKAISSPNTIEVVPLHRESIRDSFGGSMADLFRGGMATAAAAGGGGSPSSVSTMATGTNEISPVVSSPNNPNSPQNRLRNKRTAYEDKIMCAYPCCGSKICPVESAIQFMFVIGLFISVIYITLSIIWLCFSFRSNYNAIAKHDETILALLQWSTGSVCLLHIWCIIFDIVILTRFMSVEDLIKWPLVVLIISAIISIPFQIIQLATVILDMFMSSEDNGDESDDSDEGSSTSASVADDHRKVEGTNIAVIVFCTFVLFLKFWYIFMIRGFRRKVVIQHKLFPNLRIKSRVSFVSKNPFQIWNLAIPVDVNNDETAIV